MTHKPVFCAGKTPAIYYARLALAEAGVTLVQTPSLDTGNLLLDVPSFRPGLWEDAELDTLLASLPRDIMIWGGMLEHTALKDFKKTDFLQDEHYLVENARITAECTLPIAQNCINQPWPQTPALIIGWGRIGKILADLLRQQGCPVTVASSAREKQEEIKQAGFCAASTEALTDLLPDYRLMINTAPAPVLSLKDSSLCRDCVKIDLASKKGIAGNDVLWERGLPGRFAPEQSGKLIADTFLRLSREVTE